MSTIIAANLEVLNVARNMNKKAPLKSWKESSAKLLAAIDKEQEIYAATQAADIVAKQVEENAAANARIARLEASSKNKPVKITKVTDNTTGEVKLPGDATPKQVKKITVAKPISKKEIAALQDHNKAQMKKAGLKKETSPKVKAAVKKLAAKAGHKTPKVEGSVNVSTIAKELGVNPKVARATLRRKNVDRTDAAAVRAALAKK